MRNCRICWKKQAAPILLDGLSKLEYRGYDSAGMAVRDGQKPAEVVKASGKLKALSDKTNEGKALVGNCGIGVFTQSALYEKTIISLVECKSRGAYLMGITNNGNYEIEDVVDFAEYVITIDDHFAVSLAVITLQLLGYYISVARGLDVDKPRNLAKSVIVE